VRGARIEAAMKRLGIEYNCQLCYDIGVSESTLSRWRMGRPISLMHAVALSRALGITLDHLLIGAAPQEHEATFSRQVGLLHERFGQLSLKNKVLVLALLRSMRARRRIAAENSRPA
jgi:transcriptional regulator with XRE-family HTH domain